MEEERRIRGSNRRKCWKREKKRRRMRGQSRARLRTPPQHTHTPYSCTAAAASSSVATFLVSRMSLMLTMTVTTRKSTAPACGRNDTAIQLKKKHIREADPVRDSIRDWNVMKLILKKSPKKPQAMQDCFSSQSFKSEGVNCDPVLRPSVVEGLCSSSF